MITHVPLPALETHSFTLGGLLLPWGGWSGQKVKEKVKVKALDSGGSGGVITHVPLPALETHSFTLGGLLLPWGGQVTK